MVAAAPAGPWPLRLLRELLGIVAASVVSLLIFQTGFSLWRRYKQMSAGPPPAALAGGSYRPGGGGEASGGPHAPKEYVREEKGLKTFADVKGCDEAKAELEEIVQVRDCGRSAFVRTHF